MIRKIVHIDEELCIGCGLCAEACHEGAIAVIDGKAKLLREDYCDGLGDCLPACPTDAITIEEREAAEYDEAAVRAAKQEPVQSGCPGTQMHILAPEAPEPDTAAPVSQLAQWPCQIKLVPVRAPYFNDADLLIAADCTAYAYANLHADFMHGRTTLIGCPKLDGIDYCGKLAEIISSNSIRSVTVVRMEVPCCGGLEMAVKRAVQANGNKVPCQVVTISVHGSLIPSVI